MKLPRHSNLLLFNRLMEILTSINHIKQTGLSPLNLELLHTESHTEMKKIIPQNIYIEQVFIISESSTK